jgi:hypothetical protein
MKKKMVTAFLLFFASLLFSAVYAQEPSMRAAGMTLTLGMPKSEVMGNLQKNYILSERPEWGPDAWVVEDRSTHYVVAQLAFRNGKLAWASHDLRFFGERETAFSLGSYLHTYLSQLTKDGQNVPTVETSTARRPDMTIKEMVFRFPDRRVTLILFTGKRQHVVQINESIGGK